MATCEAGWGVRHGGYGGAADLAFGGAVDQWGTKTDHLVLMALVTALVAGTFGGSRI